ncbi:shikimate dehydrogenase [Ornithinimicrobium sp. W1679]|uniref:shikimate dehydrogenase n=1 Tax=Ornithinimicrobium sp. W1679 TaxID=3418770 RepID=UPI003CEB85DB
MVPGQPGPVLTAGPRRAAVVGSPVAHSLSPVLHRAAYRSLALTGWEYAATEVPQGALAGFVAGLGPEWAGLSVTMPLKDEALALADHADDDAVLTGSANTLVPSDGGWTALNTDVHGVGAALAEAGLLRPRRAVVLGGGATARSVLVALDRLGVEQVRLLVRDRARPGTEELLGRLSARTTVATFPGTDGGGGAPDVVVNTLPATVDPAAHTVRAVLGGGCPVVMDVAYAPWPSGFARAVASASGGLVPVLRGTAMLAHQAARQVRLMTGHDVPVEVLRTALLEAAGASPTTRWSEGPTGV